MSSSASGSLRDLAAGQKVFLISPRRYGKSSLIRDVMRGLRRQRILTVEVTVAASSSYVGVPRSLCARPHRGRHAGCALATLGRRVASGASAPNCASTPHSGWRAAILRSPFPACGRRAKSPGWPARSSLCPAGSRPRAQRRLAIALDEFQTIASFDGGTVEHALRAAVQEQRQVGYVFAGSEPSLMERMLRPRRPFYKAGPVMRLEKIDDGMFAAFIEARFAASGIAVEDGLGDAIVELAGTSPTTSSAWRTRPGTTSGRR